MGHFWPAANDDIPSSQMGTKWRAIQNKTANSYMIEIVM